MNFNWRTQLDKQTYQQTNKTQFKRHSIHFLANELYKSTTNNSKQTSPQTKKYNQTSWHGQLTKTPHNQHNYTSSTLSLRQTTPNTTLLLSSLPTLSNFLLHYCTPNNSISLTFWHFFFFSEIPSLFAPPTKNTKPTKTPTLQLLTKTHPINKPQHPLHNTQTKQKLNFILLFNIITLHIHKRTINK